MKAKCVKRETEHPFFDYETGTRKSAWGSPKFLTPEDWVTAKGLIRAAAESAEAFLACLDVLQTAQREGLFCRVLGSPEGLSYSRNAERVIKTFYPGFMRYTQERLKAAVAAPHGT